MFFYLLLCLLFIAGCNYTFRGGSRQIFSFYFKRTPTPDKVPGCHIIAAIATALYLGPFLNLVIGLNGIKLVEVLAIHALWWFVAIMSAWQGYYSIGSSLGSRRATVGWIDWVLDKTFGPIFFDVPRASAAPGKSQLWWIGRDGLGMFLRMCHAFPLFLALGLFFDPHWYVALLAWEHTAAFAFITVLIYAAYSWLPFKHGDDSINWSEIGTGAAFAFALFAFIYVLQPAG